MLAELRTLLAVAHHGTFAAAGDHVGLTQAAVSGQIKRLEDQLGFAIFDRTGRSATLNALGERTLARAKEILARVDAIDAPEEPLFPGGRVRIGAIASLQSTLLTAALARFRKQRPRSHVKIVPGVSLHLLDQLDAGELDLAVIIEPPFGLPQLDWHPIAREPYVLLVPAHLGGDDWRHILATQPFLRYDRGSFGGRQVDKFLKAEATPLDEVMELDDLQAIVRLVAAGIGVALAPRARWASALPRSVRAVPLGDRTFYRRLGVAVSRHMTSDPVVRDAFTAVLDSAGRSRRAAPRASSVAGEQRDPDEPQVKSSLPGRRRRSLEKRHERDAADHEARSG